MAVISIDEYISSLEENSQKYVNSFIEFMKDEFPAIQPRISFSMPMWWLGPKMYDGYVGISAAKNHFSIHFHEEDYLNQLRNELPECSFGKKCVNVKYGDEQSYVVVKNKVKKYLNSKL